MIVLPALSSVNDILDTDLILVEHSTGEGFKMTGTDLKALMKAQAVDTVALNNMNAVTSNAVYDAINDTESINGITIDGGGYYYINRTGKVVTIDVSEIAFPTTMARTVNVITLPPSLRPKKDMIVSGTYGASSLDSTQFVGFVINTSGAIYSYPYQDFVKGNVQLHATWLID